MPSLAELQRDFAHSVLGGELPAALFAGAVPPAAALKVHRDTILGALVNALRISYPTVDALVGEAFFDQACCVFADTNLPRTASLADYGAGFADFLASFEPATPLAYLPDVARLDRAVETALRTSAKPRRFALDNTVAIELPHNLVLLRLAYPADEIRAALGDDTALAAIILDPAERFVLVWRTGYEAAVQRMDAAAARFLASLLAGDGAEAAFCAAAQGRSEAYTLAALQAGIFAAPFCTVISTSKEPSP